MERERERASAGVAAWSLELPARVRPACYAGALALVAGLLMLGLPLGGVARTAAGHIALLLGPLAVMAGAAAAGQSARTPRARWSWRLLALAGLAALLGQLAWAIREVGFGQPVPFPSEGFFLFVLFHLLVAAAALVALRPARDPQLAMEIALDGLLFVLGAAVLGLRLVLEEPLVNEWLTHSQGSAILIGQVATAASFFFALLLLVWRDTDLPLAGIYGLALAEALFLMSNILLVAGMDPRPQQTGDAFELVWLAGWVMLAVAGVAAVVRPRAAPRAESRSRTASRIRQSMIPASAIFLAVMAIDAVDRPYFTTGSAVLLMAMGVVVAVRIVNALGATQRQAERRRKAEGAAFRARVRAMVARLHPHFVLNALNAVSELVREGSPAAEESVYRLAGLLRYTLDVGEDDLVPLRRELRLSEQYLHLERLRLGDRLRVRIAVDPTALDFLVPPFVLQPLVENAVRHGVSQRPGGGRVRVRARLRPDEQLAIEVADDGPGADGADDGELGTEGGLGLRGVRAQLRSHYGRAGRMKVRTAPGAGFIVRLRIPSTDAE